MIPAIFRVLPRLALMASIGLFLLCLFSGGFYSSAARPENAFPGWQLLLFGWSAIPHGGVAWLANPAIGVAWALFSPKRPGRSAALAALALAFMTSFLFENRVASIYSENPSSVAGYGPGYWLWVASASMLLLGAAVATMPGEFLHEKIDVAH